MKKITITDHIWWSLVLASGLIILMMCVHGAYLAFSASIVLGLVCILVEPSPLIFSLVYLIWDKNLPELIMKWFGS